MSLRRFNQLLTVLLILNSIDAIATLYYIHLGIGYEANPIMRNLMDWNEWAFLAFKLLFLNGLIVFLINYIPKMPKFDLRFCSLGLLVSVAFYGLICGQHCRILFYYLTSYA